MSDRPMTKAPAKKAQKTTEAPLAMAKGAFAIVFDSTSVSFIP